MISVDQAVRLRAAGVVWAPRAGDRFVVLNRDLDCDVFLISEMVVEVHDLPTGRILRFNGTTEWALDSIEEHDQLRDLLGDRFVRLEAIPGGMVAVVMSAGQTHRCIDVDAERAYARAVLSLIG